MWWKWFPWRFVVSRLARSHGFIDPIRLLSRLSRFAQPAEVTEPIELLRAGVVFHARGLINARAIQHNLDWIWPYWVQRQFDPEDIAFVPRAFSVTHVNLTHRNWTAIGQPGCDWMPIVDPAGLVTPFYDGWSLDAWIVPEAGPPLYPSQADELDQRLVLEDGLAVTTTAHRGELTLHETAQVLWVDRGPNCQWQLQARAPRDGWLVVSVRPANPEGISFINSIELTQAEPTELRINGQSRIRFDRQADRVGLSNYRHGDIAQQLAAPPAAQWLTCHTGLATAAVMFPIRAGEPTDVTVRVPLKEGPRQEPGVRQVRRAAGKGGPSPLPWAKALEGTCSATLPDARMQQLFDAAAYSLILHSPGPVYPGPYTYRRFWFRDAAFILNTLLTLGRFGQVRSMLEQFPESQTRRGYFRSQQGEWDANGAVLWLVQRYCQLSGMPVSSALMQSIQRGARWLWRKRQSDHFDAPQAGLLPAGFSAEHLGPIDFYFWDNFWAVAGLEAAGALFAGRDREKWANACQMEAQHYRDAIDRAIERTAAHQHGAGIPASPLRRMDAGAIGSVVAGYPLQVLDGDDPRLLNTVDWLMDHCMVRGGFFQDMIHSGINPYLTLHLAQVLLRAGDDRWMGLMQHVAELASPTGQWPEAVHPRTGGGCMGDGQHIWAAAEWIMMLRSCFVREEGDRLILASGIGPEWRSRGQAMHFGPTATRFGPITVHVQPEETAVQVSWEADWRVAPEAIELRLPGHPPEVVDPASRSMRLAREPSATTA
jgi:hypothetical protein